MKVNPANLPLNLVETDVVEPLETRPADRRNPVVRHQEPLLPPHEYVLLLRQVPYEDGALARRARVGAERGELGPVGEVVLRGGAPGGVRGRECVLLADDLAFEVGC